MTDHPLPAAPAGPIVHGDCAPGFESVRTAFERNFVHRGEVGAALAIEIDGRPVVDLWGGHVDAARTQAWRRDTLCVVFSNTKPATALCAHKLAEAGALDLDQPVAALWPEFAQAGKRDVTPRMLLDHTAGLPVVDAPLAEGAVYDWTHMSRLLARQAPRWEPGTRVSYHAMTFGWLVGELVRRVSGQSLGQFFRHEFAVPLALDFWIGLPESEEPRVAPLLLPPPGPGQPPRNAFERLVRDDPTSIPALYLGNSGGWRPDGFNTRAGHAAELGASNGITDARSLARLYGTLAMGGQRGTRRLLAERTLAAAAQISAATHRDATLQVPTRFGAGFMRRMDNRSRPAPDGGVTDSALLPDDAFGHCGAGGSVAFASPARRLGLAYVMNQLGTGVLLNERAHALIAAAEQAVQAARAP